MALCNLSLNLRYYVCFDSSEDFWRNSEPRIKLKCVMISVSLVICRGCNFSNMVLSSIWGISKEELQSGILDETSSSKYNSCEVEMLN